MSSASTQSVKVAIQNSQNTVHVTLSSGDIVTNTLLYDLYVKQKMSTVEIARHLGLIFASGVPNAPQIQRWLAKANIPQRSHSESQHNSLERGTTTPPMAGKRHTSATREKLALNHTQRYSQMTSDERKESTKHLRDFWASEDSEQAIKTRAAGLRKARTEGTHLERAIVAMLSEAGIPCKLHAPMNPLCKYEYDIIVGDNIALECDGVRHFSGKRWMSNTVDQLANIVRDDLIKDDYTLKQGFWMVRILCLPKSMGSRRTAELLRRVMAVVKYLQQTDIRTVSKKDRKIVIDTGLIFNGESCYGEEYKQALSILAGTGMLPTG